MSSSSSSDFSDEDTEAPGLSPAPPSALELSQMVELAQVCSFCATFREPLRLPSFSRTELQEALLSASNGHILHIELLAELHFKLAREHPTAKMEKMVQDWEKALARKLQDNWRKDFSTNPMRGSIMYQDLTVLDRVKILVALCHWKLDTCGEIQKHIATLQRDNDNEAIKSLRAREIGTDDKGVSYWYFGDESWVYAEDKPRWQLEERKPSYLVEFASAKRIRLSVNFDPDYNASALPLCSPQQAMAVSDKIDCGERAVKEMSLDGINDDNKRILKSATMEGGIVPSGAVKLRNDHLKAEVVKLEKEVASSVSVVEAAGFVADEKTVVVKAESSITTETRVYGGMSNGVVSQSSDARDGKCEVFSPGVILSSRKQDDEGLIETRDGEKVACAQSTVAKDAASHTGLMQILATAPDLGAAVPGNYGTKDAIAKRENSDVESSGKVLTVKANDDRSSDLVRPCAVPNLIGKKRTIVDDDSSDSDEGLTSNEKASDRASQSPTPQKKRKASVEIARSATLLDAVKTESEPMMLRGGQVNGVVAFQAQGVTAGMNETSSSARTDLVTTVAIDRKERGMRKADVRPVSLHTLEASSSSTTNTDIGVASVSKTSSVAIGLVNLPGTVSMSPTDPAAAPEMFDITCENCKKCYDMRYLDPPLVERPSDEWRCFECLVNDARGWPRRRKSIAREPFPPRARGRAPELSFRKRGSSSTPQVGSLSSKNSKKSYRKSHASSSSQLRSSHSRSSGRKTSDSKSSISRKSSSSSVRKHKRHKSSSSSRHHHSSSHSRRRRRHSHRYYDEFARLFQLFCERQEQRLGIENARMNGIQQVACDEGVHGWRVASSKLDDLRVLIQSLSGGSLEQDRLRGRLILIVKDQEKLEDQRRKEQELAWNILPRRQSSRIAIGRMKNQSAEDSDAKDGYSDDDFEARRPGLRSRRPQSTSNGDVKQSQDRAWRARRRRQPSNDDLDSKENEMGNSGTGNWVDWSMLKRSKDNVCRLSVVCLALVNRLLKEEVSEMFSRPVDPELDGCPNYLSVIDQPMDLGTIRSRAKAKLYRKWGLFKKDVELVWQNCRTFNAPNTMVVQFAALLEKLSRSMYVAAERKGVDRLSGERNEGCDGSEDDSEKNSLSDSGKTEFRTSVNKAWTESSASESHDSSPDDASSDDGDAQGRKRRPTRTLVTKKTRARSTRSRGVTSRTRRSTRSRSTKKRSAPTSSSEESFADKDEMSPSPVRKTRRQLRGSLPKTGCNADPPTESEDSSDDDGANSQPAPSRKKAMTPSSPPPPPQAAQKRHKPRLVISDTSDSDDSSSSSDDSLSTSSTSDSDDSDSDGQSPNNRPQPPSPSAADVSAPPPPSTPPPAVLSDDNNLSMRSTPNHTPKSKSEAKKTKTASAAKPGYMHSPPLLNSYLSPSSSSSSSDFSSGGSDSSDGDSDSD
uniref:Bromo domain-containing protein n=1 Tax=Peronospora matthiolae TaxID=2874970 RepID=A0AAV1T8Z2_9STRA